MRKRRTVKKKNIIIFIIVILLAIIGVKNIIDKKLERIAITDLELARTLTYAQFEDSDFETESNYLNFGAFFLRDLNGDGYAEKVAGTCKEIGSTDTLYLNISVNTEGYFENGVITIDGKNFNLRTAIVKDSVVTNNKIGTDTTSIELNKILPGTTKLLMGTIASEINTKADYSNAQNTVTLTGTYVEENGNEIEINKQIQLTVDWYGTLKTQINTDTETIYANESIDEEEGIIDLKFKITTQEINKQLILTESHLKGIAPALNGYMPTEVILEGTNGILEYNAETGEFTIEREGRNLAKINAYTVIITYPLEAYKTIEEEIVTMQIPVEGYYVGANNPNEQFENPITSNIANKAITVVIEKERKEVQITPEFKIIVGKRATTPTTRYVISKKLSIARYMGEEVSANTEYTVQWNISTGTAQLKGLKLQQTNPDIIYNGGTGTEATLEGYTTYKGIYFVSAGAVLGESGYINVINEETDEIIHTFTSADWNTYTANNPYEYEEKINSIRIETSGTTAQKTLMIYNIKELDDEKLTTSYDKEEFDNLTKITSYLTGTVIKEDEEETQARTASASYEEEISIATLDISKTQLSTQETEEYVRLTISTLTSGYNLSKWKDGEFIVKFPKEIAFIKINEVSTNTGLVEVLGYELYQEDNYLLKIITTNETEADYEIEINCDIEVDPRIGTTIEKAELYAINEKCGNYVEGYNAEDIYDIDSDSNTTETVAYNKAEVTLLAPVMLTTAQIASEYNDEGDIVLAPQIAEIIPEVIVDKTEEKEQTAKITVQIFNNYEGTVSEIKILGKIPFTGNTDGITGKDLGSTYTTTMKSSGLSIPTELEGQITIYYSTNENPTNDLSDTNNGWIEIPEDWSKVRTFLIDFEDYVLGKQEECKFTYQISIPEEVNYNQVSYSMHTVEFYLDTENGKLKQEIAPRKLGFRIAKKYDLILTKYRKATTEVLQGVTFKISELEENGEILESKIRTTDINGILNIEDLYVERTYMLKEIKTLSEYELSREEIKFITTVDEIGDLHIEVLEGNFKDGKIDIIQTSEITDGSNPSIHLALENEVKYNLNIIKTDLDTEESLRGVKFKLEGNGKTRTITTNSRGEIKLKGLKIGEKYTLTEVEAEGYYIIGTITFIIKRDSNGELVKTVTSGTEDRVTNSLVETEETVCPTLELEIKNEAIPTYNLKVLKVSSKTELTTSTGNTSEIAEGLEGAQFEIYSYDTGEKEIYTTDANGEIKVEGLYQYVEGKYITGKYYIKEIYAPVGYSINDTVMNFKAQRNEEGNLTLIIIDGNELLAEVESVSGVAYDTEGNEITTKAVTIENAETTEATIGLTIANEPIFSLVKTDSETGKPLEGAKFAIYEVEYVEEDKETKEVLTEAKDIEGNTIGTLETINGTKYYTVVTDETGQITEHLAEGMYKVIEVEAPEGYILDGDESNRTYYFGIGTSKPAERVVTEEWVKADFDGNGALTYYDIQETEDGGYVAVGYFEGDLIISGDETEDGTDIILEDKATAGADGIVIKYNSKGKIEWANKTYGTTYNYCRAIDITDDGYLVAVEGKSLNIDASATASNENVIVSTSDYDFIVVKYSLYGKILWAKNLGGNRADYTKDIKTFSNGSFITTGEFRGPLTSITIPADKTAKGEEIVLESAMNRNSLGVLTVKYDMNGLVEWAEIIDGDTGSYTNPHLAVLKKDNNTEVVCLAFKFSTNLVIELSDGTEKELIASNGNVGIVVYDTQGATLSANTGAGITNKTKDNGIIQVSTTSIIKYNSNLELEWSREFKLSSYVTLNNVKQVSDNGYVAVGYYWWSNIIIEPQYTSNSEEISLINNGGNDGLIIKFTEDGLIEWAKSLGTMATDNITGIVENNPNEYIVTANLGTITSVNINQNEETIYGSSLITYNNSGEIIDVSFRFNSNQTYNDITGTSDGGSMAVGNFYGRLIIPGEQTVDGTDITLYSNGEKDCLTVKYNTYGQIEWAIGIGGSGTEEFKKVEEINGKFIITGTNNTKFSINSELILDNTEKTLSGTGSFIISFNNIGKIEHLMAITNSTINDIAKTTDNGFAIVGQKRGDLSFLETETADGNNMSLTNAGNSDAMIVKYNENYLVEWAYLFGNSVLEESNFADAKNGNIVMNIKNTTSNSTSTYIFETEYYGTQEISLEAHQNIILNFTEDGNILWGTKINNSYNSYPLQTLVLKNDECWASGKFIERDIGLVVEAKYTETGEEMILPGPRGQWYQFVVKINEYGLVREMIKLPNTLSGSTSVLSIEPTDNEGFFIESNYCNPQTLEGKYTVSGESIKLNSGSRIIKYNSNNLVEWVQEVGSADAYTAIAVNDNSECFAVGYQTKNGLPTALIAKYTEKTVSPEVPAQEIVKVSNTRKTFTIRAEVKGTGGTVSIGANKSKEIVKYKENSIEDIVITPEENYQISSITINGEKISFTPDENGVVTLEKFAEMVSDKNIVVTFSEIVDMANVIVHHYLWKDGAGTTLKLATDEYITGEIGSSYTTAPKLEIEGFYLITNKDYYGESIDDPEEYYIPENAAGEIGESIEVIYYYKVQTYSIKIHHYLDGTTTSVAPDEEITDIETESSYEILLKKNTEKKYTLSTIINNVKTDKTIEIDSQRYKMTLVDGEETGTITKDIEIIYYYTDTAIDIEIEKKWEDEKNKDNLRPSTLKIQLLGNETLLNSYTLDIANGESSYIFTELYKYDENEKEIKYKVQESKIPSGYYVRSIVEQNNKYTITNSKLGSITINKEDKQSGERLAGAVFKIEKQNGTKWETVIELTTGENGSALLKDLEYGIYRIAETKAPEGYNLNRQEQEIELKETQTDYIITIKNRLKTVLPATGGNGIYYIMAIGVITLITSMLLTRNKKTKVKYKAKH